MAKREFAAGTVKLVEAAASTDAVVGVGEDVDKLVSEADFRIRVWSSVICRVKNNVVAFEATLREAEFNATSLIPVVKSFSISIVDAANLFPFVSFATNWY